MNEQLHQRADRAIRYYRDEIEHWSAVPCWTAWSRERLSTLLTLDANDYLIENEIALLRRRVDRMKRARLVRNPHHRWTHGH